MIQSPDDSIPGGFLPYIQFLGAAGTVTGSKHLINISGDPSGKTCCQVLVDCGVFQGKKEWRERNLQKPPIPTRGIKIVVLYPPPPLPSRLVTRLVEAGICGPPSPHPPRHPLPA